MSHILLVDSDALLEDVFTDALVTAGYAVTEAASQQAATEALAGPLPALVVIDFDGEAGRAPAMVRWLTEQPRHASVPVLAIATDVSELPAELPSLQKPFTVPLLLQAVRKLTHVAEPQRG